MIGIKTFQRRKLHTYIRQYNSIKIIAKQNLNEYSTFYDILTLKGLIMGELQEQAIDNLRSGNLKLSSVVKDFSIMAANKAYDIASQTDDIRELNEATKVIEGVSKMVGLSPKESQLNVQINAINGFDFIEIDEEDIKQLTFDEVYEEVIADED